MSGRPTPRLRICNNPRCLTEFVTASRLAWYCPDCHRELRNAAKRERERKQREEDPEQFRERRRKYCESHREERRESYRRYYENHREECNARAKKWSMEHPESHRLSARKWKAKKKLNTNTQNNPLLRPVEPQKQPNLTQISNRPLKDLTMLQIEEKLQRMKLNGSMLYCERMRLWANSLPCGRRDECYLHGRCGKAPARSLVSTGVSRFELIDFD